MVAKCTRHGVHFRVWAICLRNALCEIVGFRGLIRLHFDVCSKCGFVASSSDPVMWKSVFEKPSLHSVLSQWLGSNKRRRPTKTLWSSVPPSPSRPGPWGSPAKVYSSNEKWNAQEKLQQKSQESHGKQIRRRNSDARRKGNGALGKPKKKSRERHRSRKNCSRSRKSRKARNKQRGKKSPKSGETEERKKKQRKKSPTGEIEAKEKQEKKQKEQQQLQQQKITLQCYPP